MINLWYSPQKKSFAGWLISIAKNRRISFYPSSRLGVTSGRPGPNADGKVGELEDQLAEFPGDTRGGTAAVGYRGYRCGYHHDHDHDDDDDADDHHDHHDHHSSSSSIARTISWFLVCWMFQLSEVIPEVSNSQEHSQVSPRIALASWQSQAPSPKKFTSPTNKALL